MLILNTFNKEKENIMATRKEVMHKLVKEEAKNIKKYASAKEIGNITFEKLIPDSPISCIYGQATGNCESNRAVKLIKQCCSRVYKKERTAYNFSYTLGKSKLNGSPKDLDRNEFWSPIEVFIDQEENQNNGNNKRLVNYITGKTKTLRFV